MAAALFFMFLMLVVPWTWVPLVDFELGPIGLFSVANVDRSCWVLWSTDLSIMHTPEPDHIEHLFDGWGVSCERESTFVVTHYMLTVHWYYLIVLTSVLAWFSWRRRPRLQKQGCKRCGYDLRASVGTCPECGEVIEDQDSGVESVT